MTTPRYVIFDIQIFAFYPTQLFCVLLVNLINTDYFLSSIQRLVFTVQNVYCKTGTELYIYIIRLSSVFKGLTNTTLHAMGAGQE